MQRITDLSRVAARDIDQALGEVGRSGGLALTRRRGAKRSPEEIDRLADQFYAFAQKHPGLRIEQINKQLRTTTSDLALPVRKLITDGLIKSKDMTCLLSVDQQFRGTCPLAG